MKIALIFKSIPDQDNSPQGPNQQLFVEAHDENGKSINVGEWAADGDYESLTINLEELNKRLVEANPQPIVQITRGELEEENRKLRDRLAFKQYRRTQIAEMVRWVPGMNISGVSISKPDQEAGSPKDGDMIARNPKNHADKWLVSAQYFADNFEPMQSAIPVYAGQPNSK